MEKILVIDDEKSLLDLLEVVFKKEGYDVDVFLSSSKALEALEKNGDYDLILTDIKIPQISGMEVLKRVRKKRPDIPVIMITAFGTIKQAVDALKAGALDYVVKPFNVEELKIIVAQGMEQRRLKQENLYLKKELDEKSRYENMVGKSKVMRDLYALIDKIAVTDSTVLITGESGTGKEMAARAIYLSSRRRGRAFVSLNCSALPENLLESELFGHMKGSFTGAIANKKGMFEVAEKGTLFLDEVGEMSPWTQVKLLRTLQERSIRRVGGNDEISVDVRIIAATNQDLKQKIAEGIFREDLFYRLNVISLEIPPLRKRKEDIPLLVSHFLEKYCGKMNRRMKRLAPEVIRIFEAYAWPGNVRELENVVERIVAIEERETITEKSLPEELLTPSQPQASEIEIKPGFNLNETLDQLTRNFVRQALQNSGGSLKKTALMLGINYRSLRYLIEKLDLKSGDRDTADMGTERAARLQILAIHVR